MEKQLIFLSTELKQKYFQEEISKCISRLRTEKKCEASPVSVTSISVCGVKDSSGSSQTNRSVVVLKHDIKDEEPLRELPCPQTLADAYNPDAEEFRNSDFLALAESLHEVADTFGALCTYQVCVIWCVEYDIPEPSEVCEVYAALYRLQSWHGASIVIATPDPSCIIGWSSAFTLQIVVDSLPIVDSMLQLVWKGDLHLSNDFNEFNTCLPQLVLTCISGAPILPIDSKNKGSKVHVVPQCQVVSRVHLSTVPCILVKAGTVYELSSAPDLLPEEVDYNTQVLEKLTSDVDVGVLLRLHCSDVAPTLTGDIKELTTTEWKKHLGEGVFDTIPQYNTSSSSTLMHLLVLGRSGRPGAVRAIGLRSFSSLGDDVWRVVNKTPFMDSRFTTKQDELDVKIKNLLEDTPLLSQKQLSMFAHLQLYLPKQITQKLQDKGNNIANLWEETKDDLEILASEEILSKVLSEDQCSYFKVPSSPINTRPSELEMSPAQWPEYQALVEAEKREARQLCSSSTQLLGGLIPANTSDSVVALDAKHLSEIFSNNPLLLNNTSDNNNSEEPQKHTKLYSTKDQYPFKSNASLQEAITAEWPDVLLVHHHGVHYNRDQKRERYEEECNKVRQRHIRREMASTCTVFSDKDMFVTISGSTANNKSQGNSKKRGAVAVSLTDKAGKSSRRAVAGSRPISARLRGADDNSSVKSSSSSARHALLRRSPRKRMDTTQHCKPSDLLGPTKDTSRTRERPVPTTADRRHQAVVVAAELSDIHKSKLRGAVLTALEEQGIGMKNKLFKVCFKKLFAVCRPFAADVIGRGSTSRNMEKIARAHVKQVIDFQVKMCKR